MNDAEKLRAISDFFKDDDSMGEIPNDLLKMAEKIEAFGGNIPKRCSLEYREQWGEYKDDNDVVIGIYSRMDEYMNGEED